MEGEGGGREGGTGGRKEGWGKGRVVIFWLANGCLAYVQCIVSILNEKSPTLKY